MASSVGPTAKNLIYGDAAVTSAKRHLSGQQFPVKTPTPSIDGGWLGPVGSYGNEPSSGSLYGYGVPSSNSQY